MIGRTISHYRITEKLGEGAMGVVYKAEDTKLKRPVALKFLAPHLLGDSDEKERFLREAQAAAALDHPNICTVHEIDEAEGQIFIAMAYIAGQSLKDKIAAGPLKLEEALGIAIGVGGGLQEAHEHKIVHRDIKSANIMLTLKGEPKITDFGLAYLADRSKLTKSGTTLGTPVYMSPEQALGKTADRRSDVWSLGVVLYEMITGLLPFEGEHEQVIIYEIINGPHEPVTARRAGLPMELDRIVGKSLAKDADERYQHVEDMTVDLRNLRKKLESGVSRTQRSAHSGATPAAELQKAGQPNEQAGQSRKVLELVAALVLVVVGAIVGAWLLGSRDPAQQAPLLKFTLSPADFVYEPAVSPNGRHIAYLTGAGQSRKMWVHDLDRDEAREIPGTEGANGLFWSPSSDLVGFRVGSELKTVPATGGTISVLCQLPPGASAGQAWSPDGNFIVFSRGNRPRLYQVSARGGTPSLLIEPNESEENLAFVRPHFLPLNGGRRVLLFAMGGWAKSRIVLRDLETGAQEILANGNLPVYSPSGHILYQESEVVEGLWALPYSIETLKPTGEAFPVARQGTGPSVSANGTLVYRQSGAGGLKQLGWRDLRGAKLGLIGQPQESIGYPALSPDGQQVAVRSTESGNYDIWIHDVARPVKTRLTIDPGLDSFPTWSSAGDHIAFASTRLSKGGYDVFLIPVDGSTEAKSLVATSSEFEWVTDWSKNREFLLYERRVPKTLSDLWYSRGKDGSGAYEAVPFLQTPFRERGAKFSPDGRFVTYYSDESGRFEVYVRPLLEDGKRVQVSTNGGVQPRWSRHNKEIYYIEGDTLVSVGVTTTPSLSVDSQNKLFRHASLPGASWVPPYDVSADGQKFVVVETLEEQSPPVIRVVQNWYEEFRDRGQD